MEKRSLKYADSQAPSLLVFDVPNLIATGGEACTTFALPLQARRGGLLLALPVGVLDDDALPTSSADEDQMVGPAKILENIDLYEEIELETGGLQTVPCDATCQVLVCDFQDSVLQYLREYDPVTDSLLETVAFDEARPQALPLHADILGPAMEWAKSEVEGRVLFYSAREELESPPQRRVAPPPKKATSKRISNAVLAEQVATLGAQMQLLMKQQPPVTSGSATVLEPPQSFAALANGPAPTSGLRKHPVSLGLPAPAKVGEAKMSLVGPPPKVRAAAPTMPMPPEEPYHVLDDGLQQDSAYAMLSQQSAALTALVSHLINQEGGIDVSGIPGASSSSTKGTVKREKMQQDLAARRSSFFLQIQQQIFKKLHPSRLLPKTEEELAQSQTSLLTYLERYGGYKGQKEAGLCMWILAHAMDAAASNDFFATKEFLALAVMAMEQSVFDAGDWSLAYVLALAEDPPSTMFAERMSSLTATSRPFSPLVPPILASTNLSYIKELEVLATRRAETRPKKGQPGSPSAKASGADEENPSPRKPKGPRFPKKPKAIADA